MDNKAILDELIALLEQNGVAIRTEPMDGGGAALCKIKDKPVFFVDTQGRSADMAVVCARAVRELIDIEKVYIKPQIREFIETHAP